MTNRERIAEALLPEHTCVDLIRGAAQILTEQGYTKFPPFLLDLSDRLEVLPERIERALEATAFYVSTEEQEAINAGIEALRSGGDG